MNKKVFLVTGIGMLFLMTGCSGKTSNNDLSCKKEDSSMTDMQSVQNYAFTFKKDKMVKIEASSEIKVDGEYKKYTKELLESLEQQFATVKGKDGVRIKSKKSDNNVSINASMDLNKIGKDASKLITMVDTTLNEEKTKKSLEDQGFTCK